MFYFIWFIFGIFNMIFFGIINISLFKYFCDLPTNIITENYTFFINKIYFISSCEKIDDFVFMIQKNDYFINFLFIFIPFILIDYMISFFFFLSFDISFSILYDYIEVFFQTSTSNYNFIEFCTLQKFIYVIPNETHLIFFRMYNSISYNVLGISIYLIYPSDYLIYFNKIQCFCFEELLLYSYESIDLPVVFYISNEILNYIDFFYSNKLYLSYLFLSR